MPSKNVEGPCPKCNHPISTMVHWTTTEETSAAFNKYIARGFFMFGLTAFLFTWGLTLMNREYDMKKLTKVLEHPETSYEDTSYNINSVNPEQKVDCMKVSKVPKNAIEAKHLSDVNLMLQKKLDETKKELEQARKAGK